MIMTVRPIPPEQNEGNTDASEVCKPKQWPSTSESVADLKRMLDLAKKTADSFHKQAQIDPDSLHDPVTL